MKKILAASFLGFVLFFTTRPAIANDFKSLPELIPFSFYFMLTVLLAFIFMLLRHQQKLKQMQNVLSVEREKYLQTLLSIGDGVLVVDRHQRVEMLNPAAEKITGWPQEEALGRHYREIFKLSHELADRQVSDPIQQVFATDKIQQLENHAVLISRDGKRYNLEDSAAPIKNEKGETIGVVLVFRDVTEKKEQRKKIEFLSYHDPLTGLYNRYFFEEELRRLDVPRNLPIAIIMGDVDGLKLANDIFGHAFGDLLLQRVARTIKEVCRADDIIARWGGDEFVILLPRTNITAARSIARRIQERLSREEVQTIKGSISIGCGVKTESSENIILALERAEDEMYEQKTLVRSSTHTGLLSWITEALHAKFPVEMAHAQRVSEMCLQWGKALKLDDAELKLLKEVAYYHDIGKIVLDESILLKAGVLKEEEYKEVRQHPVVGFRILNFFDDTMALAQIVLAHHERWDGLGYPKGLKGKEIPKLARMIALVESCDMMIHDMPFRRALSKREAAAIIKKNANTQFDPELTENFLTFLQAYNFPP
ncbi:MAG: diguanylate cyclase [Firmicutes bacterium]|nr:diguanylate cyclase [Bacillota bacterium]